MVLKGVGIYSPGEILVELAKMNRVERKENTWVSLYLQETSRTEER